MIKDVRVGTLFLLDASTIQCNSSILVAKIPIEALALESKLPIEKTMAWHQRLGHIGEKGLHALKNKNMVDGLNDYSLEFDFCEHCIYGKQNHVQFYYSSHKSSRLLDLIHFDVFGLIKVPSISRALYYVSFVDEYLRRTWVYFLRSKYDIFNQFKEFKALLEN